ncbi:atherin-like isoform X2 [Nannospalax galili]|nr:atherin-like isoform X2 [Nannospalax galili]
MQMPTRSEAASPSGHCALNPDGALPAPSRPLFPGCAAPPPPPPPPARGALPRSRPLTATWVLAPEERPGKLEAWPTLRLGQGPGERRRAARGLGPSHPVPRDPGEGAWQAVEGATRTMPSGGGEIIIIALTSAEGFPAAKPSQGWSPCRHTCPWRRPGYDCAFHAGGIAVPSGELAEVAEWGGGSNPGLRMSLPPRL